MCTEKLSHLNKRCIHIVMYKISINSRQSVWPNYDVGVNGFIIRSNAENVFLSKCLWYWIAKLNSNLGKTTHDEQSNKNNDN